jgi:uncharacterized protein (TIGR03083 family)
MFAFDLTQPGYPRNPADYDTFVTALAALGADAVARLATADPAAPVPTCPAWQVRQLAQHLGNICGWAVVGVGSAEEAPRDRSDPEGHLAAWVDAKLGAFLAKLRSVPFDLPSWTFAEPHTAGFWARRMMGEYAIHLYDLALALAGPGAAPDWDVPEALALDGVGEVFDTMYPRQIRLGRRQPLEATLRLTVQPAAGPPETFTIDGTDPAQAAVDVTCGPQDAYLAVWGRHPAIRLPALTS